MIWENFLEMVHFVIVFVFCFGEIIALFVFRRKSARRKKSRTCALFAVSKKWRRV